jgi:hypothetical protein
MFFALAALSLGCVALVVSVLAFRAQRVNPDQVDVDELALEVGRIAKQVRRDRMRAVRAGEGGAEDPPVATAPPELRSPLQPPQSVSKDDLRRLVFPRTRQ